MDEKNKAEAEAAR